MRVGFEDWTKARPIAYFGTNAGADVLPFQSWRRFKEAFTPELIARAVAESEIPVRSCLDMFGGSGTTALACQFLGIHPVTIEVNPFLADLIEAKLASYDADRLVRDLAIILRRSEAAASMADCFDYLPATFVEPGEDGQWIFNHDTFERIAALKIAIESLAEAAHRRLFRVLLGGIWSRSATS